MQVVVVTAGARWPLLMQTLTTITRNASDWSKHELILSTDCWEPIGPGQMDFINRLVGRLIINRKVGASAARNIGAASVPKYKRQQQVCFFDDDVYCVPGWDKRLETVLADSPCAASGHAHPFNHTILGSCRGGLFTNVLSTVNIACPWEMWDAVGWFAEPGGPGGSEDVDWCARASKLGYGLAVTSPHCVIHTGLTGSHGNQIVGYAQMVAQNEQLEKAYGLEGKVVWR